MRIELRRLLVSLATMLALALALPLGAQATGDDAPDCANVAVAQPGGGEPVCDDEGEEEDADDDDGDEGADCAGDDEPVDDEDAEADAEDAVADELVDDEGGAGVPLFRDFCTPPAFDPGFLARSWPVLATADGYADGRLSIVVDSVGRVPARWREQVAQLLDVDAVALVGRRVPVTRRRHGRVPRRALRRARSVRVVATLLAPDAWSAEEDGLRVPTFSARAVRILR